MSDIVEVRGLVIRNVDIHESDRLITIFTEERGVLTAEAKSARSLKSRKFAATAPFCYANFQLYSKGDKYWVRECELLESFFDIRKTLPALSLGAYILEVLSDVTVAEADRELLRLSLNTLYAISRELYDTDKIKAAFELRAASILGFMPDVTACRDCGGNEGEFFLDIMDGTVECSACRAERAVSLYRDATYDGHEARIICPLSPGARTAMAYCIYAPLEKLFSFRLPSDDMRLFSRAAEEYITNHLERGFHTLDFYHEVTKKSKSAKTAVGKETVGDAENSKR